MDFTTFMFSANNSSSGLLSKSETDTSLLSNNNSEAGNSILSTPNCNGGFDFFGGYDIFGSPDFSDINGSFFASASQAETVGSVAFASTETTGSVASAGMGFDAGGCACACGDGGGSFSSIC